MPLNTSPPSTDKYLAALEPSQRDALQSVREAIRSVAPDLHERVSSGAPFFWYRGKRAIGFGAAKSHLSLYIMHGSVLRQHQHRLAAFGVSNTVVRFTHDNPLPMALIRELVKARLSEIEAKNNKRS